MKLQLSDSNIPEYSFDNNNNYRKPSWKQRATHHDVSHARIKYDTLKKKKGGEILVHVRNGDTR